MFSPDAGHGRQTRLPRALSGRRGDRWATECRSSASPRRVHADVGRAGGRRCPITTNVLLSAAPVGEPALGPVAFMHRASAAAIVFAPLNHHTFDSTHISFGVITAGLMRGRWAARGIALQRPRARRRPVGTSIWGGLIRCRAGLWFRPTDEWTIQVSTGHLVQPEELEIGDVERTTASASWTRAEADSMSAMTVGYGRNDLARQQAAFGEFTRQRGANTWSSRFELVQIAGGLLAEGVAPDVSRGPSHGFGSSLRR